MRRLADVLGLVQLALVVVLLVVVDSLADRVFGLVLLGTLCVGWLVASRLPRHPIGWLLLAFSGLFLLTVPTLVLGTALLDSHPTAAAWLLWHGTDAENSSWAWLPPLGLLFTQVLLHFPDGRLPSPRWRWVAVASGLLLVLATAAMAVTGGDVAPGVPNPATVPWVRDHAGTVLPALAVLLQACMLASALSVWVRYRRSGLLERTQIRWLAWASGAVVVVPVVSSLAPDTEAVRAALTTVYGLIPASIGLAVLRYRLYDIDRIVSRTLSYAVVTATAVGVYAVVVTSVSRLVDGSSSWAVAAATLVAAAVFRPLLGRVRSAVDRRFDRERYDAQQIVESFGARLRDEVHTDAAAAGLVAAVGRTLAPVSVGLWVREPVR